MKKGKDALAFCSFPTFLLSDKRKQRPFKNHRSLRYEIGGHQSHDLTGTGYLCFVFVIFWANVVWKLTFSYFLLCVHVCCVGERFLWPPFSVEFTLVGPNGANNF